MRHVLLSFLIVYSCFVQADTSSGEHVALPPTVLLTEVWLYNQSVPVYQVDIKHAGESAELLAAQAAVASVRPEFTDFDPKFQQSISNYVVGRQDTSTHTRIYIARTIVADWLIMS